MTEPLSAILHIEADGGPEAIDAASLSLRRQLLGSGLAEPTNSAVDRAPAGAKSAEALTLGAIAITVLPTMLPAFFEFLKGWLSQRGSEKVVIEFKHGENSIRLEGPPAHMTPEAVERLVGTLRKSTSTEEEKAPAAPSTAQTP